MVDFRIRIVVDTSQAANALKTLGTNLERATGRGVVGIERVNRGLTNTITTAERLRRALLGALQLFGLTAVIRELLQFADTAQRLENRLRLVASSMEEVRAVNQELFRVANATRTEYELTAEIFARVASSTRTLGVNQRTLIEFTESVNQAVAISGATFEEAHNALIQFSQGIARGVLRGDELRSVLEQLPAVADVIADHFGVSRGQIILFAEQGKITAETILTAFKEAREELANKFGKTIPTISQAMTIFRNKVIELAESFNRSTGIVGKISQGIVALSGHVDLLARSLIFLTGVIGTLLVGKGILVATKALKQLFTVLSANPFTIILTAIVTLSSLFISFGDKVNVTSDGLANLHDVAVVVFDELAGLFGSVKDAVVGAFESIVGEVDFSLESIVTGAAKAVDGVIGFFIGLGKAVVKVFDPVAAERAFGDFVITVINSVIELVESGIDLLLALFDTVVDKAGSIGHSLGDFFRNLAQANAQAFKGNFAEAASFLEDGFRLLEAGGIDVGKTFAKNFKEASSKDIIPKVTNPFEGAAADLGVAAGEAFLSGFQFSGAEDKLNEILEKARQRGIERNRATENERAISIGLIEDPLETIRATEAIATATLKVNAELEKLNRTRQQEAELLGATARARAVANEVRKVEEDLIKDGISLNAAERERLQINLELIEAYKSQQQILESVGAAQSDYGARLADVSTLLSQHRISIEQAASAAIDLRIEELELGTSVSDGLERGFLKVIKSANDLASVAENVLTNAFSSAEDALTEFLLTGKFNFSGFVDSVLADVARLVARQALLGLLNAFTGGSAGVFAGLLQTAAGGAQNTRPGQPFLVGEEGPELFVPQSRGDIIPHGPSMAMMANAAGAGGGGGGAPIVNVAPTKLTVINVTDPNEALRAIQSDAGGKAIINHIGKQRNAARRAIG